MTRVTVLGLGYIGLPTAAMLALHGSDVTGFDVQGALVQALQSGNIPVRERDLSAIVRDALSTGHLRVSDRLERADVYIICVPTPSDGPHADLTYVIRAARMLKRLLRKGNAVIVESTVPPGTTISVVRPILEEPGLKAGRDFHLAYCPERVMPGRIIHEISENDRVIGGFDPASAERAKNLYRTFVKGQIYTTDLSTAEFVKLAENAYRDVNVALANEFARLAEAHEVNVWEAIDLANRHPRVSILRPGPGVGGHCIAVDPWFLLTPKVEAKIIPAARAINDSRPEDVVRRIQRLVRGIRKPKIAAFGVAYKGNADDVRESPAVKVIERLREEGLHVLAYDPQVPNDHYPTSALEDVLTGADCLVILADHREFQFLDPRLVASLLRRRTVFDARNCLDRAKWARAGFEVHVLGDPRVHPPVNAVHTRKRGRVTARPPTNRPGPRQKRGPSPHLSLGRTGG